MKAMINREGMLAAFNAVANVAPTRSPKPILQNVKFVASEWGSILMATDLEVGIRQRVLGVNVELAGEVILPMAKFRSILKTSRDAEIHVDFQGATLVVRGARSEFKLPSEDPALFPEVTDFTATSFHTVSAQSLGRMIRRTIFACDPTSTRYTLGGALLELTGDTAAMCATDGRRLARMVASAETENQAENPLGQPVIPLKALRLINQNIDDEDPPVHIAFDGKGANKGYNAILIRTERSVIYSRLVEGRFPRYEGVFPGGKLTRIPLDATELLAHVGQAMIMTSENNRGVDFVFGGSVLQMSSSAADAGSSSVEMPVDYEGEKIAFTLDARYLVESLKTILGDESELILEAIGPKDAVVMRFGDDYTYVLMPLITDV
jgi:DNA polymerase-3 subunit beta